MELTDEELAAAVHEWFERRVRDLTCREEEQQEAVMRLAAERFPKTDFAGALARVWLFRKEFVRQVTQKNVALFNLETGIKSGWPQEKLDQLRAKYEPLQRQVDETKERCREAARYARLAAEKRPADIIDT